MITPLKSLYESSQIERERNFKGKQAPSASLLIGPESPLLIPCAPRWSSMNSITDVRLFNLQAPALIHSIVLFI